MSMIKISRVALEQVLEALAKLDDYVARIDGNDRRYGSTIAALHKALAQPKQEPARGRFSGLVEALAPQQLDSIAPIGTVISYLSNDGHTKWAFQPEAAAWLIPQDQQASERGARSCFSVYTPQKARPLTMIERVDAAMVATANIYPRITRSQCETIIRAGDRGITEGGEA